jgi:DNA repair exonuclease SbcCD nuclease subunit
MKAFVFGDLHLGVHPLQLDEYVHIVENYFFKEAIPYIEANYEDGDVIVQLGDVFDNRTAINIKAMCVGIRIFEALSSICDVHVLCGNHDMYQEKSREYISINALKFKNVHLHTSPNEIKLGGRRVLMCPYVHSTKELKDIISNEDYNSSLLFAHTDLYGARWGASKSDVCDFGLRIDDYSKFDLVVSGHIHIRQKIKNVLFTGTPYHLSRKDIGNKKGFHVIDMETLACQFVENTISPEYVVLEVNENSDFSKIEEIIEGKNWVDLKVNISEMESSPNLKKKVQRISETGRVKSVSYVDDVAALNPLFVDESKIEILPSSWDLQALSTEYINQNIEDSELKDKVLELIREMIIEV